MTAVRKLCSLLGILSCVGVLILAQSGASSPVPNVEDPTMGILVGSAERSVGISVNPVGDGSQLDGTVIGGTARDMAMGPEGGSWSAVISTNDGDFRVEATLERTEDQHTFTYEITNLSLDGDGTGVELLSMAVPLAGNARVDGIAGSAGWGEEVTLGSLGGFLLYQSGSEEGVSIGETATLQFSLPALPSADGEASSQEMPLPPGIFLGADLKASPDTIRVIRPLETGPEPPRLLGDPDPDWICREGSPWYFERPDGRGICVVGAVEIAPGEGADLRLEIAEARLRPGSPVELHDPPSGDILVAVPLRPGQAASPDATVPEGWAFEAPPRPDRNAGFAVFTGELPGLSDEQVSIRMPFSTAELAGLVAGIVRGCMDWQTGECTVEIHTIPGNQDVTLLVSHSWLYWSGSSDKETIRQDGTTDFHGDLTWTFTVDVQYTGRGGRVRTEFVTLILYWVSSTAHDSEWMDQCYFEIFTPGQVGNESVEYHKCRCD